MRALQALQPQIKELQAKYKNDKQRMQQEMMRFYKENKVNPFASCIPLVAQLPVFITLFYVLRHELRRTWAARAAGHCADYGASFLFIHDLTAKATGSELIVLLVLYVGTQLASGYFMSVTADKSQRIRRGAPAGSFVSTLSPVIRKNTNDLLVPRTSFALSGFFAIHWLMRSIDISSFGTRPRSMRMRPTAV